MRAVVLSEPGQFRVADVPDPQPAADEVVVRVTVCGLCGTDQHIFDGDLDSARYPLTPGHELAGVVVGIGADVHWLPTGTRVAVDPNIPCEHCHYCHLGRQNLCVNYTAVGVTRAGGFAELVAVPARCCYPLPEHLPDAAAGLVEPLACAVHGLDRLTVQAGAHCLVYGAGTMGLLIATLLGRAGAGSVSMVDLIPQRLQFARSFGLDRTASTAAGLERPGDFEIVVDATGAVAAIEDGLARVRPGGTFLQFGVTHPKATAAFSPFRVYNQEIDIIGSMAVHHSVTPAIELLTAGLDLTPLVSTVVSLDEYGSAMQRFAEGSERKLQIDPRVQRKSRSKGPT